MFTLNSLNFFVFLLENLIIFDRGNRSGRILILKHYCNLRKKKHAALFSGNCFCLIRTSDGQSGLKSHLNGNRIAFGTAGKIGYLSYHGGDFSTLLYLCARAV